MATIIDLNQYKEDTTPHTSGTARCLSCKHEWVAVAPAGTVWLECPSCSCMLGRHIEHVYKGEHHWVCDCGNDLFLIGPEGAYCPVCGTDQTF